MAVLLLAMSGFVVLAADLDFKGRPLVVWLDDLAAEPGSATVRDAEAVIESVGPAAVPTVMRELRSQRAKMSGPGGPHAVNGDPRWFGAWRALELLGPMATPAVPELVQMMGDANVSFYAARALERIGPNACTAESVRVLSEAAIGPERQVARAAGESLASWGPAASNAVPKLLQALRAESKTGGPVRSANLPPGPDYGRVLAQIAPDSEEVLLELLAIRGIWMRGTLDAWLGNSSSGQALLLRATTNQLASTMARKNAISYFSNHLETNLFTVTQSLLEEAELRTHVLFALRRYGTNGIPVFPVLISAARRYAESDPDFADSALLHIGECGHARAAELIRLLLPLSFDERHPINCPLPANTNPPIWSGARLAVDMLAGHAGEGAAVLTPFLSDRDWQVRNGAAARLWGMNDLSLETINALATCLLDTNAIVRLSAAVTLARVPSHRTAAAHAMFEVVPDGKVSNPLRVHALQQLDRIGFTPNDFPEAAAIIDEASKDSDPDVRQWALRLAKRFSVAPQDVPE